jgi:hypothetical protein
MDSFEDTVTSFRLNSASGDFHPIFSTLKNDEHPQNGILLMLSQGGMTQAFKYLGQPNPKLIKKSVSN